MAHELITHDASGMLQLQAITVSDYKRQKPVGYLSLPAESRNMIVELILVPGETLPSVPKPNKHHHNPFPPRRMLKCVME